jgi:hypothetical protein
MLAIKLALIKIETTIQPKADRFWLYCPPPAERIAQVKELVPDLFFG